MGSAAERRLSAQRPPKLGSPFPLHYAIALVMGTSCGNDRLGVESRLAAFRGMTELPNTPPLRSRPAAITSILAKHSSQPVPLPKPPADRHHFRPRR